MVSLDTVWYNFERQHQAPRTSAAMVARLSKTLWSMDNIIALIDAQADVPKRPRMCKTKDA